MAAAITLLAGTFYFVIQQYIRLSANDIPLQYAEDVRNKITGGEPDATAGIKALPKVDLVKSLEPFVIVFDSGGVPVAGNAVLGERCPTPPAGVFSAAKQKGSATFTWQPLRGVRLAAVLLPYNLTGQDGYVLGGCSMREVEQHERFAFSQVAVGTIFTLFATFVLTLIIQFIRRKPVSLTRQYGQE